MRKGLMLLALLLCVTCTLSACTGLLPNDHPPESTVYICRHDNKDALEKHTVWISAVAHAVYYVCPKCGMESERHSIGHSIDAVTGKCECGAVLCTHDEVVRGVCTACEAVLCTHDSIRWDSCFTDIDDIFHATQGTCRECGAVFRRGQVEHTREYRDDHCVCPDCSHWFY